jgi:membrane protein
MVLNGKRNMAQRRSPLELGALLALTGLILVKELAPVRRPAAGVAGGDARVGQTPAAAPATHGTQADTPLQIPAGGWWQIAKRVVAQFSAHRIMAVAAGIVFYTLLALFPAIAALVSLYGLFADASTISDNLTALSGVMPGGGMDIIKDQVARLTQDGGSKLGIGLVVGLGTALWSANQGVKALFDGLNIVYDEPEKRGFVKLTLTTLAVTAGALVFVVLALYAIVVLPVVLNFIGLSDTVETLLRLVRWPVLLAVVGLFLAVVYRYGPSRERARWQWVSVGGAFAAVVWLAASGAFSWYVSSFGSYNKTYGSLGAAVGFMTWIWISTIVVLVGAELNAEMEHQTAKDTTTGPPQPTGGRGANKADAVA